MKVFTLPTFLLPTYLQSTYLPPSYLLPTFLPTYLPPTYQSVRQAIEENLDQIFRSNIFYRTLTTGKG